MKILNLKITNLASIGNADIDFENGALGNCNTFLITGPTGAGKTTILDAISLALYNITSRIQNKNITSREAIERIRTGCKEAEVILTIVGNDNIKYRITWKDKIIRKKDEEYGQTTQQIQNLETNEIISDRNTFNDKIRQSIIGLDSEQFFRTTMLAQQEFTKFLKSDEKEKSNILSKLSDTGKYAEIGKYINAQYNETNRSKELVKAKLEGIVLLTEEQKSELTNNKQIADNRQNEEKQTIERLQNILNIINEAEKNERENQQLQLQLNSCSIIYCQNLSLLQQAEAQLTDKQARQKELQLKTTISDEQKNLYNNISQICADLQSRQNAIEANKQLADDIKQANKQLPQLNNGLEYAKTATAQARQQYNTCVARVNELGTPDVYQNRQQQLNDKKAELSGYKTILQHIKTYQDEIKKIIGNVEETKKSLSDISKKLAEAKFLHENAVKAQEKAQTDYNKTFAEAARDLDAIRQTLHEGDICPVCGQKVTAIASDFFINWQQKAAQALNDAKNETAKRFAQLQSIQSEYSELEGVLKEQEPRIEKGRNIVNEQQQKLQQLSIYQEISNLDDNGLTEYENQLNIYINQTADKINNINQATKQLAEETSKLSQAEQAEFSAKTRYDNLQEQIKLKQQQTINNQKIIKQLEEAVSPFMTDDYRNWKEQEFGALTDRLKSEAKQYNDARLSLASLNQGINNLSQQTDTARQARQKCLQLQPQYAGLEETSTPYDSRFDTLFITLATQLESLLKRQQEIIEKQKALAGQSDGYTIADKENILQQKDEHSVLRDNAIKTSTDIQAQFNADNEKRKSIEDLNKQLEDINRSCELWKELNTLYGGPDGKNFQKIAQAHVMRYLLDKANRYLTQLTSRYTMTCDTNSLRIMVIDHEAGNQQRDSSNLSGGESFIVSLALALGLSDLNAKGLQVDTLFIDEGFGTLSGEPLQHSIDTLLNLHNLQNGRKVGIISHIDKLKENIRPQILIKKVQGDNSPGTIEIIE